MASDKKPDEKKVVTPPVVTDTPVKEETPTVDIDTTQIEKDVVDAARKQIVEGLTGKSEEKWRPKDYEEIKETTKEETLKAVDEKFEEKEKAEKAQVKAEKAKKDKQKDEMNVIWDNQIKVLVEEGKIPAVAEEVQAKLDKKETLTVEEMRDPGLVARTQVYTDASANNVGNLELAYYKYYDKTKATAGATAPVFGAKKSVAPSGAADYSYEDIHGTSTPDLIEQVSKNN